MKDNVIVEKKSEEPAKELQEHIDKFQRLQAEFANYIKRAEKDRQDLITLGKINVIKKLLNVHDAFDKALEHLRKIKGNDAEFVKGVEMIFKQFNDVLSQEGLQPILCEGEKFDPHKHEVILQVENNGIPEDTVVQEVQKGFMLNDKVIRYSKVCVCKHKNDNLMEVKTNDCLTSSKNSEVKTKDLSNHPKKILEDMKNE